MNNSWRVTNLIRALSIMLLIGLLAGCTGGGGGTTTGVTTEDLALQLFAVSPGSGPAPLQTTLTAVFTGGTAPYDVAWDFNNDGSFDAFNNNTFDLTVSRTHEYNLRAADAGAGTSTYKALVKVTDATGKTVTSDTRDVVVTAAQNPDNIPDPEIFVEDELGNRVDIATHVFNNGERLKFHFGDRANLDYQWDFNFQTIKDGQVTPVSPTFTVDSTAVSPDHIFYNTGTGQATYAVQVKTRNPVTGATDSHIYNIAVAGTIQAPTDKTLEAFINSNPPAGSDGIIVLRFDPTGNTPGVPIEPHVELSALVSSDPDKSGDPPYEYYWDFENDGKIDKAAQAPTVPYFDPIRKVTLNPYLHNQDVQDFQLRLLVIDIKGHHAEVVKTVRALNVGNRPPAALSFDVTYGFGNPLTQYVEVTNPTDPAGAQTATFTITPKGSTGNFQYKIDVDGDGLGDIPTGDTWADFTGASATETVTFGPHDDPSNPGNQINPWPEPNYYATQVLVRALDVPGGSQVDKVTKQTPLSLVQVGAVNEGGIDTNPSTQTVEPLPAIQDMVMVPFALTAAGGGNGQSLTYRGVVVAGGAKGTTALRDVFRIREDFTAPSNAGELETHTSYTFDNLVPMTVARRGAGGFIATDPNTVTSNVGAPIYVWGGRNPSEGALASGEFMLFDPSAKTNTWTISGTELRPGGDALPLYDFGIFPFQDSTLGPIALFTGGLNQPSKDSNANVSGLGFAFAPQTLTDPSDDAWLTLPASMSVPRYDLSVVAVGNKVYAIGGRGNNGQSTATTEVIDVSSAGSAWVQLANMKDARAGCTAQVIDPDGPTGPLAPVIYVYGGAYFPGQAGSRTLVNTAEVFNPATNTWSYTLPPTVSSYAAGSARLPGPGSVKTGSEQFNSVWLYGGESGQTVATGETNRLQEFVYFYNVP